MAGKSAAESFKEYGRGIAGGLLFSVPLLYTQEVWQAGFMEPPLAVLVYFLATFLLLLGYNRYSGLRPDASISEILSDSIEEMGLGLIMSVLILLLLKRIDFEKMSFYEIQGKVIIEGMIVAIGVSIGTAQLGASTDESPGEEKRRTGILSIAVLSLCGSFIVGGNVAPTQEVFIIAAEANPYGILLICLASIVLGIVIVFYIDFLGSYSKRPENFIRHVAKETAIAYSMALVSSAFALWFFGQFDGNGFRLCVSQVIVLGLISTIGASAGRLLIK